MSVCLSAMMSISGARPCGGVTLGQGIWVLLCYCGLMAQRVGVSEILIVIPKALN